MGRVGKAEEKVGFFERAIRASRSLEGEGRCRRQNREGKRNYRVSIWSNIQYFTLNTRIIFYIPHWTHSTLHFTIYTLHSPSQQYTLHCTLNTAHLIYHTPDFRPKEASLHITHASHTLSSLQSIHIYLLSSRQAQRYPTKYRLK